MITALAAGLVAGLAVALPAGAIGTYLIALGARERLPVALAAAFGVATTDGLYALLAALAGRSLQPALRSVADPLRWLSCLALIGFGLRIALVALARYRQPPASAAATRPASALRSYLGLAMLTALNPATVGYFVALVLGRQASAGALSSAGAALFGLGALLASAAWQASLAGGGAALGRLVAGPRAQLGLAVLSAAIMLGLAASLISG